ncbi:hypothetical protein L7F22_060069 [Adiantum nelumboides]|nr:hypothetical protein [Adiantum nelumboides]
MDCDGPTEGAPSLEMAMTLGTMALECCEASELASTDTLTLCKSHDNMAAVLTAIPNGFPDALAGKVVALMAAKLPSSAEAPIVKEDTEAFSTRLDKMGLFALQATSVEGRMLMQGRRFFSVKSCRRAGGVTAFLGKGGVRRTQHRPLPKQ